MKHIISVVFLVILSFHLRGQAVFESLQGSVTYISSQNVYVKFASTEGIKAGDTLFVQKDGKMSPGLKVKDLSSISCVCSPFPGMKFAVDDKLFTTKMKIRKGKQEAPEIQPVPKPAALISDTSGGLKTVNKPGISKSDIISGRLSVSSSVGFSNYSTTTERMLYTFSMNAQNIRNSKVSAESYIAFTHMKNHWQQSAWKNAK